MKRLLVNKNYEAVVTEIHVVPALLLIYARVDELDPSDRKYNDPIGAVTEPFGSPVPETTNNPPGKLNPRPAVDTAKPLAAATFVPVGVLSTRVAPAVVEPTFVA